MKKGENMTNNGIAQIQLLEQRVHKTVEKLMYIHAENLKLKERLERGEARIEELELVVLEYQEQQHELESSITSALNYLDSIEDTVVDSLATSRPDNDGILVESDVNANEQISVDMNQSENEQAN